MSHVALVKCDACGTTTEAPQQSHGIAPTPENWIHASFWTGSLGSIHDRHESADLCSATCALVWTKTTMDGPF